MGLWSRARCVRLTADENNAEVSTRAQKTRNTRPAPGLRTTAAEARNPRCDAPKHVSKTSSGSCSRAVETFIVLYSCPHCSTLPLGSQALCKVLLQMSRTALAQGFHDSWARLAASPRQLIGSTPQPRLASEERPGTGLRHFWGGANASSIDWLHPQITQKSHAIANGKAENAALVMNIAGP